MRASLVMLAALLGGCDCSGNRERDAGAADAQVDAGGEGGDAGGDGGGVLDAGDPEPLPCIGGPCGAAAPYCCADSTNEPAGWYCFEEPTMLHETENQVLCWEYPVEPGSRPVERCDGANACPADRPWCCTGVAGRSYCSVDALYGWGCVDLAGVPAGPTGLEREDLIRRCADAEPCPADNPYCCDNLFCSAEPLHGWSCAIR